MSFYFIPGRVASFESKSFTYKCFEVSTNLQEPLSVTLKNFVKANWPTSSILSPSQIRFGNKWFDDFASYQIHFRDSTIPERPISVSWQYLYISHMIDIHLWVRKNQLGKPQEMDDMKRSVTAVIELNTRNLPIVAPNSEACFMHVVRQFDMQENTPLETLWHSVIQCEVRYWKASST